MGYGGPLGEWNWNLPLQEVERRKAKIYAEELVKAQEKQRQVNQSQSQSTISWSAFYRDTKPEKPRKPRSLKGQLEDVNYKLFEAQEDIKTYVKDTFIGLGILTFSLMLCNFVWPIGLDDIITPQGFQFSIFFITLIIYFIPILAGILTFFYFIPQMINAFIIQNTQMEEKIELEEKIAENKKKKNNKSEDSI